MAKLDRNRSANALFVTLTYPGSWQTALSTCKANLHAWAMRFQRRYARGSFIWRYELQKNGQPHFHLIVLNVPFVPHEWVARSWYEVVGSGNPDHLDAGTEVRRVKSHRQALAYAAKYAAKMVANDDAQTDGRVWGIYGRKYLGIYVIQWELEPAGEARLGRFISDLVTGRSRTKRRPDYPPRWAICDGSRGIKAVAWAAGLTLGV